MLRARPLEEYDLPPEKPSTDQSGALEEELGEEPGEGLGKELQVASELAWKAGKVILGYFRTELAVDRKNEDEPVTRADRESGD